MKKAVYTTMAFDDALRAIIALAEGADSPPELVYSILRAWVVAFEKLWEENLVPPAVIADIQGRSYELAEKLMVELRKNKPIVGKFPDELPDREGVGQ